MNRPLRFFGGFGALGILAGSCMATLLLGMKIFNPQMNVMRTHGPMFVIGSVLIVAGIQLLAIGLLGELQVRLFYAGRQRTPYAIESLVRLRVSEEPHVLSQGVANRD
jgi:hypothetical protein